jgi:hypothetical protein
MAQVNTYLIKIRGQLSEDWSDWFGGLTITAETASDGVITTTLAGPLVDQAALHGVLSRLHDLNLTLISVDCLEPTAGAAATERPRST